MKFSIPCIEEYFSISALNLTDHRVLSSPNIEGLFFKKAKRSPPQNINHVISLHTTTYQLWSSFVHYKHVTWKVTQYPSILKDGLLHFVEIHYQRILRLNRSRGEKVCHVKTRINFNTLGFAWVDLHNRLWLTGLNYLHHNTKVEDRGYDKRQRNLKDKGAELSELVYLSQWKLILVCVS